MDSWQPIPEFPGYSVSFEGRVRNDDSGRILATLVNQSGVAHVGMVKDHHQHKRSLALLVAEAFLGAPQPDTFDTPINLDGDRTNCHIDNLMWRPRWFAVKYHQQFHNDLRGVRVPIREIHTGQAFPNSWDAATKFGLIDREILLAIQNRTYVWPTYQEFEIIEH